MSDFLTHLASRAVAPIPAVRPLVRSPYESQDVDEFKLPEALPAPAILGFQSLRTVQPRVPITPGRGSEIMDQREAPRPPQPVSPAPARIHESSPAIVPTPVQVAARLDPLENASPRLLAATSVPESQSPASLVPVPVVPSHLEAKAIAPTVIVPVESVVPRPAGQNSLVPPDIAPVVVTQPEHRPPAAAPLPSLRPQVHTVPQIFPRQSPSRPDAATPQPAPQVTITIGRVEIRAAAPAVQAPLPTANSGPPLSLETYLRRSASRSA